MRISDWSSDVCSSDLVRTPCRAIGHATGACSGACYLDPPAFPTARQEPSGARGDQRLCRLVTWHSDRRLSLHSEAYTAEPVLPACDRTRCLASAVRRPGASKADHPQCDLVRPLP